MVTEALETTQLSLDLVINFACLDDKSAKASGVALAADIGKARAQDVRIGYACPERLPAFRAGLGR